MLCYALGALEAFDDLYDIEQIEMTIFQTRRENISTSYVTKDNLLDWAENVLKPIAQLAYEGKGEFKAGNHFKFCKVKTTCRKRAEMNLELAKYDFKMPNTLDDFEISAILPRIDELIKWGNDIKDYALSKTSSGTHFDGFKIVEGRSNRKYKDNEAVAKIVEDAGFDPYEKKLLSIIAVNSLLEKTKFEKLLGDLIYKPPGKPALVPESDKRPEMKVAAENFKDR